MRTSARILAFCASLPLIDRRYNVPEKNWDYVPEKNWDYIPEKSRDDI